MTASVPDEPYPKKILGRAVKTTMGIIRSAARTVSSIFKRNGTLSLTAAAAAPLHPGCRSRLKDASSRPRSVGEVNCFLQSGVGIFLFIHVRFPRFFRLGTVPFSLFGTPLPLFAEKRRYRSGYQICPRRRSRGFCCQPSRFRCMAVSHISCGAGARDRSCPSRNGRVAPASRTPFLPDRFMLPRLRGWRGASSKSVPVGPWLGV